MELKSHAPGRLHPTTNRTPRFPRVYSIPAHRAQHSFPRRRGILPRRPTPQSPPCCLISVQFACISAPSVVLLPDTANSPGFVHTCSSARNFSYVRVSSPGKADAAVTAPFSLQTHHPAKVAHRDDVRNTSIFPPFVHTCSSARSFPLASL